MILLVAGDVNPLYGENIILVLGGAPAADVDLGSSRPFASPYRRKQQAHLRRRTNRAADDTPSPLITSQASAPLPAATSDEKSTCPNSNGRKSVNSLKSLDRFMQSRVSNIYTSLPGSCTKFYASRIFVEYPPRKKSN